MSGAMLFNFGAALFLRALGLLSIIPLGAGSKLVGRRILWAFGLALLFAPSLLSASPVSLWSLPAEFLIGFVLSIPCALVVSLASAFGELFDTARGQTIGQIYEPLYQTPASVMSSFLGVVVWANLLYLGCAEDLLVAFKQSLKFMPPGAAHHLDYGVVAQHLLVLSAQFLSALFLSVLPAVLLFLMLELLTASGTRLIPQLSHQTISFQAKMICGFLLISLMYSSGLLVSLKPVLLGSGIKLIGG